MVLVFFYIVRHSISCNNDIRNVLCIVLDSLMLISFVTVMVYLMNSVFWEYCWKYLLMIMSHYLQHGQMENNLQVMQLLNKCDRINSLRQYTYIHRQKFLI
jgi:hypothetical protein